MLKPTHILFTADMDCHNKANFSVTNIANLSFDVSDCGNFKGTEQECIQEGERLLSKFQKKTEQIYVEPHYPNAQYGSIYDY